MARRRKILDDALRFDAPVESEVPAAPLEGEGYDDWRQPQEHSEAVVPATAEEPVVENAEKPAEPAAPSRDYGNWRFTPWKSRDMWTNKKGETSFDEKYVRKFRHQ